MSYQKPIRDLIIRRNEIYEQLPRMVSSYKLNKSEVDSIYDIVKTAFEILLNSPSFYMLIDNTVFPASKLITGTDFIAPFDRFSIVVDDKYGNDPKIMAFCKIPEGGFAVVSFAKKPDTKKWWVSIPLHLEVRDNRVAASIFAIDDQIKFADMLNARPAVDPTGIEDNYRYFVRMEGSTALASLHRIVFEKTILYREAAGSKLNISHAAKAKDAFWEYNIVNISALRSIQKCHLGGTHASPKQHERRGHLRTYKSGKQVFIKSMVVGKIENGRIDKDYEVR